MYILARYKEKSYIKNMKGERMRKDEINKKLKKENFPRISDFIKALFVFLKKEQFLLKKGVNERSITHKLAEYLQREFQDYYVDCEYNRMLKDEIYITKNLKLEIKDTKSTDLKQTTVYPDIIIHKRGNNEDNLLVIEVKKEENNSSKKYDIKKLEAFTNQLNYKFGFYIEFNNESVSDFEICKKGVKCQLKT